MSNFDFKAVFRPGELKGLADPEEYANQKIWAILQCERRLFANPFEGEYHGVPVQWRTYPQMMDTHSGILVYLGKIEGHG